MDENTLIQAVVDYKPTEAELLRLKLDRLEQQYAETYTRILAVLSILEDRPISSDMCAIEIAQRHVNCKH